MFSNIYNYVSEKGVVVPDTTVVRADIEQAFKNAFNDQSLDTTSETAVGRLIEAVTKLFVDVIGVNAQNLNSVNPYAAADKYLDSIGSLFGVSRNGDGDNVYRQRILASWSTGIGFPQTISNALSKVGCNHICVLENGTSTSAVRPGGDASISVAAHSIFVALNMNGATEEAIANAIYGAKSAGCGFSTVDGTEATVHTKDITDADGNVLDTVTFYELVTKSVKVDVTAINRLYTGTDILSDITSAVKSYLSDIAPGTRMYSYEIATAIQNAVAGVVCSSIQLNDADYTDVMPYDIVTSDSVTVNITIS